MLSGDVWSIAVSDLLTFVSLAMLLIEMITAVGSGRELLYHGFSVLAFFVALILFITMRGFSTSVFFFITVMAGIGVVGGYTISIVAAEHDLGMGNTNTEIGMFRTFFPLLLISIVIYNLLAFGYGLTDNLVMHVFLKQSWAFHIFTGDTWNFNLGDLLILVSLGLLFLEIIKATRTTRRELFSHGLAAIVFVIALVEFITMKGFSTSVFFFITAMAAFDTVAEYMIGIVAAEHDLGMGRAGTD